MANTSAKQIKFNVTFWQMFVILTLATTLGGVIYKYAYDNVLLDEINSISFSRHAPAKTTNKSPVKKTPAKTKTPPKK